MSSFTFMKELSILAMLAPARGGAELYLVRRTRINYALEAI